MKNKSSETLAMIVVAYRSLGSYRSEAIEAMQELDRRAKSGDKFDFESFIQRKISVLPPRPLGKTLDQLKGLNQSMKQAVNDHNFDRPPRKTDP